MSIDYHIFSILIQEMLIFFPLYVYFLYNMTIFICFMVLFKSFFDMSILCYIFIAFSAFFCYNQSYQFIRPME